MLDASVNAEWNPSHDVSAATSLTRVDRTRAGRADCLGTSPHLVAQRHTARAKSYPAIKGIACTPRGRRMRCGHSSDPLYCGGLSRRSRGWQRCCPQGSGATKLAKGTSPGEYRSTCVHLVVSRQTSTSLHVMRRGPCSVSCSCHAEHPPESWKRSRTSGHR